MIISFSKVAFAEAIILGHWLSLNIYSSSFTLFRKMSSAMPSLNHGDATVSARASQQEEGPGYDSPGWGLSGWSLDLPCVCLSFLQVFQFPDSGNDSQLLGL